MKCASCGAESPEEKNYCADCGSPLKVDPGLDRRIQEALAAHVKDQRVVEIETAEAIVARLSKWARLLSFFVGIPLGLLLFVLGYLGLTTYSRFSELAEMAESSMRATLEDAQRRLEPLVEEIERVERRRENERLAPRAAPLLIVMIKAEMDQVINLGAGIIFSGDADRLYVATANHLVRRRSTPAENIEVRIRSRPGEVFSGELLDSADFDLNVAVLGVAGRGLSEGLPFDRLGDTSQQRRGETVFHIGYDNGQPWWSNVLPHRVAALAGDTITFGASTISRGAGGSGLFNDRWELIGMVTTDQPPEGTAVKIERLLQKMDDWGYPISLSRPPVPAP